MATNFPTSLDSYTTKTNDDTVEAAHINNPQDAIEALEAKVGVDSSAVATSHDYLIGDTTGGHDHDGSNSKKVDAADINGFLDEDAMGSDSATGVASQQSIKAYVGNQTWNDGWIPSSDTWTYASATTFTIASADRTSVFTKGTKIKCTNSTTKYFYVVSSAFSTNTTVTVTGESDLANAAITSPKYSYADCPQGFKRGQDWYACRVRGDATAISSSHTLIPFDDVSSTVDLFDTNGDFNTTGHYYTVPVSGRYSVSAIITYDDVNNAGELRCELKKDSTYLALNFQHAAALTESCSATVSGTFQFSKGDAVWLYGLNDTGTTFNTNSVYTFMSIQFIGI